MLAIYMFAFFCVQIIIMYLQILECETNTLLAQQAWYVQHTTLISHYNRCVCFFNGNVDDYSVLPLHQRACLMDTCTNENAVVLTMM